MVEHDIKDPSQIIILAKCDVREIYAVGESSWRNPKRPIKAEEAMREYISYTGVR